MPWQIREDPDGWKCKMPVYKFPGGNGVLTKMGIEDSEGVLRLFFIKLNDLEGVVDCGEFKKE